MSARVRLLRLGVAVAATAAFGLGAAAPANAAPGGNGNGNAWGLQGNHGPAVGNGGGANADCSAYCHVDGQPSENGYGNNNNGHEAGSKGAADNKFPPGQSPDGTDHNNGYECDGNGGVGQKNPAHSGCADDTYPEEPPVEEPSGS